MGRGKGNTPVKDKFPDEYIFALTTKTPWFIYIANYLVSGKFPSNMPKNMSKGVTIAKV